jgi:hypothetical protein
VLVAGKPVRVIRKHIPRAISISLKGQKANSVSVALRVKVSQHGRTATHTVTHRFNPCVSK